MRVAYFDCFSGASGDMIVAALIDGGAPLASLRAELAKLPLSGFELQVGKICKQGFACTRLQVSLTDPGKQTPRHLKDIRQLIGDSGLDAQVKQDALRIFERLAEAEAHVHGQPMDRIHFHEVGAVDAIVDVTAALVGLRLLGVERVYASPIPVGSGTVTCEHGVLPVPAPATAALLEGVPLAECDEPGELTTPTGAAVLTTLAHGFGTVPPMTLQRTGVGAGQREGIHRPNVLRVLLGDLAATPEFADVDQIAVVEASVDDISPEVLGYTMDRLLGFGALDAYFVPISMKHNRPGVLITVLCDPDRVPEIEELLFAETTTFGVRHYLARRSKLTRKHVEIATPYGPIRIKVGRRGPEIVTASPEYEDCRLAAERTGVPLREVMAAAIRAWAARASADDA
jgi:uncharacterized protein (TIGR00299 family) protein